MGEPVVDVSVVMLCFGPEPWLTEAATAVLASTGVRVELVLVDNGCTNPALAQLAATPGVRMLRPGANLGFTGGVNLGADAATGPVLALVNSDARVQPDALALLVARLADPAVGVVGGLVLLADEDDVVNSSGNPLHVLGLSWAGGLGTPAQDVPAVSEVTSASGALLAIRRSTWQLLDGFPTEYFAYLEDMELCWRVWQLGLRVELVGAARAWHHYEFSRNPLKMYLLERNRLLLLLTVHQRRTLALLAFPLLAFEVAITVVAATQGWWRQKARGWWWVLTHLGWIRTRRRVVRQHRVRTDRQLAHLLSTRVDPVALALPAATASLERVLTLYWRFVERLL